MPKRKIIGFLSQDSEGKFHRSSLPVIINEDGISSVICATAGSVEEDGTLAQGPLVRLEGFEEEVLKTLKPGMFVNSSK